MSTIGRALGALVRWWRSLRGSRLGSIVAAKALADVAARGSAIAVVALMLRYSGNAAYGAWSQLQVIVSLLGPFAVLGIGHAIVPHFASTPWDASIRQRLTRLTAVGVTACAVAVLAFALAAPVVADLFLDWSRGAALFRWGSLLVGLVGLEWVVLLVLQTQRRFIAYVIFQGAAGVLTLVAAAAVLPATGDIVTLLVVVIVLRAGLLAMAALVAFRFAEPADEAVDPSLMPGTRFLVKFGIAVAVADVGAWAVQLADRLVLGHFESADALGAYAAIYTATGVLTVFGAAVFLPVYPEISAAWETDGPRGVERVLGGPHHLMAFGSVPLGLYLCVVLDPALRIVGHGSFRPSPFTVAAVVLVIAATQWNGFLHYVVVVVEGGRGVQPAWLAGGVVAVLGALALVPVLGVNGAAASTLLAFCTINVLLWRAASQHIDVRAAYAWRTTALAVLVSVVGAAAAELSLRGRASVTSLMVATAVFWSVYGVAMTVGGEAPLGRRRRATTYQRSA